MHLEYYFAFNSYKVTLVLLIRLLMPLLTAQFIVLCAASMMSVGMNKFHSLFSSPVSLEMCEHCKENLYGDCSS